MDLPEVSRLAQWDIECAVRDIPFHSHTPISAASEWGSQWRRSKVRLHLRWQLAERPSSRAAPFISAYRRVWRSTLRTAGGIRIGADPRNIKG